MATKPTAQQCHALTTYYVGRYQEIHNKQPLVNRNKARYGFEGLLMDNSPTACREIIDYYLDKYEDRGLEWFFYNYESVVGRMKAEKENEVIVAQRRQVTQDRLEQWRNRWKK